MPNNKGNKGNKGAQRPNSASSDYNAQTFLIQQILARVSTATLVKIVAVTNAGELSPVGFVDVQPLVNQLDGDDQEMAHGVIYGLPYFRMQGGANAVVIDPQVNDIGMCMFADRDISKVKATKAQANPGSKRKFNMADGLYVGGVLNGTPTQYVQFSSAGIVVHSPTKIKFTSPVIELTATESITSTAPTVDVDASTSSTVTSPQIAMDASTSVIMDTPSATATHNLNVGANAQVDGTAHINGTATADVDVLSGTISLRHHLTTLVTPGILNSGPPLP